MSIDISTDDLQCFRCGTVYKKKKGSFATSYNPTYKAKGRLPICKSCIDEMYTFYCNQFKDEEIACRNMCRKLDLYWNKSVFDFVRKGDPENLMQQYIIRLTSSATYSKKTFDESLIDEGRYWEELDKKRNKPDDNEPIYDIDGNELIGDSGVSKEVINFWGEDYDIDMYRKLEKRRAYWMSRLPSDIDINEEIGAEVIIKQICAMEIDINRDRAAGKNVDKMVNTLVGLVGGLNLKPDQRKGEDIESELSSTPMGLWLYRYENKRPLPDIEDKLKDSNHIKKYMFTWMGHLCKMLDIKNGYTKLYEEEVSRLRVERPEYEDDSEEDLLSNSYSEDG